MTRTRTRALLSTPRVVNTLAVAGALVLGGSAYAYADGTPSPSSSGAPSTSASGAPSPGQSGAPKPGQSGAPTPGKSGAPRPGQSGAPTLGKSGAAKPGAAGAPAPGKGGPAGRPGPGGARPAVEGTVSSVSGSTLTVTTDAGKAYTVTLASGATVHEGPKSVSLSSITKGERVAVAGAVSGSTVKASSVDVHLAHIDGTVTAVDGDTVTVVDHDGFHRTIDISGVSNASVKVGQQVHAEGMVASDGTTLMASSIGTPPAPKARSGN